MEDAPISIDSICDNQTYALYEGELHINDEFVFAFTPTEIENEFWCMLNLSALGSEWNGPFVLRLNNTSRESYLLKEDIPHLPQGMTDVANQWGPTLGELMTGIFFFFIQLSFLTHLSQVKVGNINEALKKQSKGSSTIPKTIQIGSSIRYRYDPHEPTRKNQRHCEMWGVRGHYRHYQSGKVVFVKPHVKGKGAMKDTNYSVGKCFKGGD